MLEFSVYFGADQVWWVRYTDSKKPWRKASDEEIALWKEYVELRQELVDRSNRVEWDRFTVETGHEIVRTLARAVVCVNAMERVMRRLYDLYDKDKDIRTLFRNFQDLQESFVDLQRLAKGAREMLGTTSHERRVSRNER